MDLTCLAALTRTVPEWTQCSGLVDLKLISSFIDWLYHRIFKCQTSISKSIWMAHLRCPEESSASRNRRSEACEQMKGPAPLWRDKRTWKIAPDFWRSSSYNVTSVPGLVLALAGGSQSRCFWRRRGKELNVFANCLGRFLHSEHGHPSQTLGSWEVFCKSDVRTTQCHKAEDHSVFPQKWDGNVVENLKSEKKYSLGTFSFFIYEPQSSLFFAWCQQLLMVEVAGTIQMPHLNDSAQWGQLLFDLRWTVLRFSAR